MFVKYIRRCFSVIFEAVFLNKRADCTNTFVMCFNEFMIAPRNIYVTIPRFIHRRSRLLSSDTVVAAVAATKRIVAAQER